MIFKIRKSLVESLNPLLDSEWNKGPIFIGLIPYERSE